AGPVPDADQLVERVVAGVVEAVWQHACLKPGAIGALDLCARYGLVTALASGSARPVIDAVLERFDLASRFAAVCTSADDPYGKPHPAVFLRAAEQVGVGALRCVVVEDSLLGCVAAKAASMRVIAVPEKEAVHDPGLAIADLILRSLEELAGLPTLGVLGLR
ncbi:MAG: HAD-IA family hydrolase, partial [Solirubrobacteraceae bacterium]